MRVEAALALGVVGVLVGRVLASELERLGALGLEATALGGARPGLVDGQEAGLVIEGEASRVTSLGLAVVGHAAVEEVLRLAGALARGLVGEGRVLEGEASLGRVDGLRGAGVGVRGLVGEVVDVPAANLGAPGHAGLGLAGDDGEGGSGDGAGGKEESGEKGGDLHVCGVEEV